MPIVAISPTKDCYIRSSAPTTNHDTDNLKIGVGYNVPGAIDRSLMHFDLSSLPSGYIFDAYVEGTNLLPVGGGVAAKARRLTQTGWVENQVTYNNYATGTPWASAGGDFTSTDEADWVLPSGSGTARITNLAALCRDAVANRSSQLHLITMTVDEATDGHACLFRDSEYGTPGDRVVLYVVIFGMDFKVRGILPRTIVEPIPASVQWEGMRAAPQADFWVVNRGVHPVRARALEVEPFQPRSQLAIRKVNKLKFRASFVGLYHNFGTAEYRFYRSNTAPPVETDTPFATNASLPYTPVDLFADGIWYVSVAYYNGILTSGFLPLGPNGETYIRIEISGGVVLQTPPNPPISWELELRPAGVIRVKAFYQQTGSLRATQWAITYTTNGATPGTPPAVSPTVSAAMPSSGAAVLEYDLPGQADGTTVKVRLQTRRNDGGTWRYSENSIVKSLVADAAGPIAPLVLQPWPGRLPEGV